MHEEREKSIVERVNDKEKSHANWTKWHILEKIKREEKKDKTVSFQSTKKSLMIKQ